MNLKNLKKLSGDASFRSFYRKKKYKQSSIIVFCKKQKRSNLVIYLINFLQIKNKQSITEISSPTFNLIHEYQLKSFIIKHYDLYRINDEKELINIGIYEDNFEEIRLIEWPEKMKKNKTNNIIDLNFEYDDEYNNRFLTISSNNKVSFINEFK